ncbi:MAG: hypothetical protein WKF86_04165 [Acidimicrobiales bacterium]
MTTFAVRKFSGDGYAIASKESVDSAHKENYGWSAIEGVETWDNLRSEFDYLPEWMAEEIISAYGEPEDWPDDGEEDGEAFECPFSIPEDLESELDLRIAASMLDDVPDDILGQFNAVNRTTHDGDLGFIWAEDLERFIEALEAAGHTVERKPGG